MTRYLSFIAAIIMMCLLPEVATAATVIENYRFAAETEGPVSSFVGTTTIAFDAGSGEGRLLAFDLGMPGRAFTAANVALDTFLGGRAVILQSINQDALTLDDVVGPAKGYDGFLLVFIRPDLSQANFGYTLASEPDNEEGYGFKRVTLTLIPTSVPEPAAWAMLILGFAAVGAALRQRSPRRPVAVSG